MKNKKILYIDMDGVLVDFQSGIDSLNDDDKKRYKGRYDEVPNIFLLMKPIPGAIGAFKRLSKKYDTYILSTSPWNNSTALQDKQDWIKKYLKEEGKKRIIFSHHKNLNKGDYLIDDRKKRGADKFEGEHIHFGKIPFLDWYNVLDYLMPGDYVNYDLQSVMKNILKRNKKISKKDAEKNAKEIIIKYKKDNHDRDKKRSIEDKKEFEEAVSWEFLKLKMDTLKDN